MIINHPSSNLLTSSFAYFLIMLVLNGCRKDDNETIPPVNQITINGVSHRPFIQANLIHFYHYSRASPQDSIHKGIAIEFSFSLGDTSYSCFLSQEGADKDITKGSYKTGYAYMSSHYGTKGSINAGGFITHYNKNSKQLGLSYEAEFGDTVPGNTLVLKATLYSLTAKEKNITLPATP